MNERTHEITHRKIAHIFNEPGREYVKQAVHRKVANLGKRYEVIVFGKEAGEDDATQAAQEKDKRVSALACF